MKTHSRREEALEGLEGPEHPSQLRNEAMRAQLEKEKVEILQEVEESVQKIIVEELRAHSGKWPKPSTEKVDEVCYILQVFLQSSRTMIDTYFTLLQNCELLELCAERVAMEKAADFKAALLRSCRNMEIRIRELSNDGIKTPVRSVRKSKSNPNMLEKSHVLVRWLLENFQNPYPSKLDKEKMMQETDLSLRQINNWFINVRERTVKKHLRKENKEAHSDDNDDQESLLNSPMFIFPDGMVKKEPE